ncbi:MULTISPECIES: hypothetical protein [Chryseobacterium]|uniref:Uncharacterized protein n=1 Tax=Chryseobacterium taihuense TaxID=1141221 RepID=A0A4V6IDU3_9FLAO|nr:MULTISPECIES: hypothetical protein [Chryseobacterium]QQV01951.1 hypothetical protein I6I61_12820 [Chryseobacterium sp. FDAARGOS 1104]VFB04824.1 Uncharacterised protein [Chryseobacterium taihuense]
MVRNILILLCSTIFINSYAQTRRLENGTKVLTKQFKNIDKFNKSILKEIDTNHFYKKIDYYMADKNFNKVRDIGSDVDRKIQFYENGRVRFFSLGEEDPNPENAGRRGIIYLKNGDLKIDSQGASQDGDIFRITLKVIVEGDKIYLLENNFSLFPPSEYSCYVYQKSEKIPENWKQYNADW